MLFIKLMFIKQAELISRIEKKLATLKEEETMLVDEVTENAQLGKEVRFTRFSELCRMSYVCSKSFGTK